MNQAQVRNSLPKDYLLPQKFQSLKKSTLAFVACLRIVNPFGRVPPLMFRKVTLAYSIYDQPEFSPSQVMENQ